MAESLAVAAAVELDRHHTVHDDGCAGRIITIDARALSPRFDRFTVGQRSRRLVGFRPDAVRRGLSVDRSDLRRVGIEAGWCDQCIRLLRAEPDNAARAVVLEAARN